MGGFIAWLSGLPFYVLYPVMALAAALENLFPPIPADTIVALGSWLASRGDGTVVGAFLATWVGNVAGAASMYHVGRAHGDRWIKSHFKSLADGRAELRFETLYGKYGVLALVVSRLIPGVRAAVPPFAGALKIPPVKAIGAMAVASGVWYGIVSYIAFNAGSEWDRLSELLKRSGLIVAAIAVAILVAAGVILWVRHRRAHD